MQKQQEEETKLFQVIMKGLKPKSQTRDLLRKYENDLIGINLFTPTELLPARLVRVYDDFFSLYDPETRILYSFPLRRILSVMENPDGFELEGGEDPHPCCYS